MWMKSNVGLQIAVAITVMPADRIPGDEETLFGKLESHWEFWKRVRWKQVTEEWLRAREGNNERRSTRVIAT